MSHETQISKSLHRSVLHVINSLLVSAIIDLIDSLLAYAAHEITVCVCVCVCVIYMHMQAYKKAGDIKSRAYAAAGA